jgi:NADPH2:quinone reductase
MKAAVLDTDDQLRLADIDEPTPGPGEVAIHVEYAGVQWGDVLVRNGHFPVPRPFVPGFEGAGHIIAVGEGVRPERIGEHVTALSSSGAFAEILVAPSVLALTVDGLDSRTAASFGWVTPAAYDLVNTVARIHAWDRVLIHAAAGGVGSLAVQFARLAGAQRIVGVVGDATQADYAKTIGYDAVLEREQFLVELRDEQFDAILDPIGGPARVASLERLAAHGRLVVYGNIASFEPVSVSINDLLTQGQSVATYNSNLLSQTHPSRLAESAVLALEHLKRGDVHINISREYELAHAAEAIQDLTEGTTHGKSILHVT